MTDDRGATGVGFSWTPQIGASAIHALVRDDSPAPVSGPSPTRAPCGTGCGATSPEHEVLVEDVEDASFSALGVLAEPAVRIEHGTLSADTGPAHVLAGSLATVPGADHIAERVAGSGDDGDTRNPP